MNCLSYSIVLISLAKPNLMTSKLITILLIFLPTLLIAQSAFDKMSNSKMEKVLIRESTKIEGTSGNWQLLFRERPLMVITDTNANRMRIMTAVAEESELTDTIKDAILEANFDRALDAKYAVYKGYVWSVFTHPLEELTVEQLKDAMIQVVKLSENYGSTYTSTDLVFGGGD